MSLKLDPIFNSFQNLTIDSFKATKIFIGNSMLKDKVESILKTHANLQVETDFFAEKDIRNLVFGRDHRLTLLDGSQLLPYCIKDPFIEQKFKALLPLSSAHFISSSLQGYGQGFNEENSLQTLEHAQKNGLKFQQAKSCLEGGNVHFLTSSSTKRAIIGNHSLVLSLLGLEEQKFFEENPLFEKQKESIKEVSDDTFRLARNHKLLKAKLVLEQELNKARECRSPSCKELQEQFKAKFGNETVFKQRLLTQPTIQEMEEIKDLAFDLEAKLQCTKEVIAEEIGLPLDQIAFVNQTRFHIDMEIFVGPNDLIVLHDDKKGIEFLESIGKKGNSNIQKTTQNFLIAAKKRIINQDEFFKKNLDQLKKMGCNCVSVAGVFEGEGEDKINFMNGIFLNEGNQDTFITNEVKTSKDIFKNSFIESLKMHAPKMQVFFIEGERDGTMQEILSRNGGGIHCLSWVQ